MGCRASKAGQRLSSPSLRRVVAEQLQHRATLQWAGSQQRQSVLYDPWPGLGDLTRPASSDTETEVSIVDLRVRQQPGRQQSRETGSQTEGGGEEELDWDLSDTTDRETQTDPAAPAAVMVQTDQRLVWLGQRHLPAHARLPSKHNWSQTSWEVVSTAVQVGTSHPGPTPAPPSAASPPVPSQALQLSLSLETDIDLSPFLLASKSSIVISRAQRSEAGVQTERAGGELSKLDLLGDDPLFLAACDEAVNKY